MGAASGHVRWVLRAEGLMLLCLAVYMYGFWGFAWSTFAWCFFLPDVAFLGYLVNRSFGAVTYNITHSLVGPLVCLAVGLLLSQQMWLTASAIWLAHIGFDRALGYGLKYAKGFGYTHLGLIGKAAMLSD